jgi:hypothetical protein
MPTTLTIPPTTVAAGTHQFGPVTPPKGSTEMTITLDVSSYPADQTVSVTLEASYDGGSSYTQIASSTRNGGLANNDGVMDGNMTLNTNIGGDPQSNQRRVRAAAINAVPLTTSGGSVVTA